MPRILGIALLVVGIILIFFGIQSGDSLANQMSETFTGTPTDRTMWYWIGGIVLAIVGAGLLFYKPDTRA
jgi:membrane protease YdiL (CAAX protease family)